MSHSIRVRILNRDFSLRVGEQDEALTREIASYVDAKIQNFLREHPHQPEITASIIAALAIAEELFTEREERDRIEHEMLEEIDALADELLEALPAEKTAAATPVS